MNYPHVKKIWGLPLLLAALTLFGLLSALLGTGIWYWVAWHSISVPLIVIFLKIYAKGN